MEGETIFLRKNLIRATTEFVGFFLLLLSLSPIERGGDQQVVGDLL